jgi:hypothetical protein
MRDGLPQSRNIKPRGNVQLILMQKNIYHNYEKLWLMIKYPFTDPMIFVSHGYKEVKGG